MCNSFIAVYMPYCLRRLKDGSYLPLNRSYKPLGTREWADYEAAQPYQRLRLTPEQLAEIDQTGSPDADGTAFLYDDGTYPGASDKDWNAYVDRLTALAVAIERMRESEG